MDAGPAETVAIREIAPGDVKAVFQLVLELAEYEKLRHTVTGTSEELADHLFGPERSIRGLVAESDTGLIGYALYFTTYSTFRTRPGLWLEDLYVTPVWRGRGVGKALLGRLMDLQQTGGFARLEWSVLDWNQPAIDFYENQGAQILPDWRICRIESAPHSGNN